MADVQNYQVNYDINVRANGIQDVTKFAEAINKLKISQNGAENAIRNVKNMMDKMDAMFKPKGRKRDISYNVNVKTDLAEEKLDKVLNLIKNIQAEAAKIQLVINAGQKLDSQAIKAQAKAVLKNQELAAQEEARKSSKKMAKQAMEAMREPIEAINKTIGKVNSALVSLETGREINIKTDVAKRRLEEILGLLGKIKGATNMTLDTKKVAHPVSKMAPTPSTPVTPIVNKPINAGYRPDMGKKGLLGENKLNEEKRGKRKTAKEAVESMSEPINAINQAIGKVNAALISLQTGREVNVKTDVAKKRLEEILGLLGQIKGATNMTLGTNMVSPPVSIPVQTTVAQKTKKPVLPDYRSDIEKKVLDGEGRFSQKTGEALTEPARKSQKQERESQPNIREKFDGINKAPAIPPKPSPQPDIKNRAGSKPVLDKQIPTQKAIGRTTIQAVEAIQEPVNAINKLIGRVNAALVSLETGREIKIKTGDAKKRLEDILGLLNRIKETANINLSTNTTAPSTGSLSGFAPIPPVMPDINASSKNISLSSIQRKVSANESKTIKEAERELKRLSRENEKEFKKQDREYANLWNKIEKEQEREYRANIKKKLDNFRKLSKDIEDSQKRYDKYQEYVMANKLKMEARQEKENKAYLKKIEKEQEKEYRTNVKRKLDNFRKLSKEMEESQKRYDKYQEYSMASQLKREAREEKEARHRQRVAEKEYYGRQKGAINRLQYSRLPSWNSVPFAGMFSAYAGYSVFKSELADAVEYANVMETARSILRVADSDLSTFEDRFEQMSRNVRQIGIDTKFTAMEIAGATKFLAMAGMNIDTINKSMRPITNLALIGDADVAQIADLATNIMSGYDIRSDSMNTVADILASTIARSNVNVLEMAESFKMAAGYLRLSGVNFTEASAAIGILGNAGMKGTMAGTALRAMSGRFAKPTKEARDTLNRLGVKFTEFRDIYGKQVEKLRPLADIFEDLNKSGATLGDMQAIFGKIGGNAAMMFIDNYEELRTLANQNKASNGISKELALKKQNTTKGLWDQMTSQFSESFMQAYESMEPLIRGALKDLLERFKPREFAKGLETIGRALLDVFSVLGKIGAWVTRNLTWLEPLFVTGFVATRIFKLVGALSNLGVALGIIGKQKAATSVLTSVAGALGTGKASQRVGGSIIGKIASMFGSQVTTGGMIGATASLSAISAGALAATGAFSALVSVLGYTAYKTWQVKQAHDAITEEINSNKKYRYPSIDALTRSLNEAYSAALATGEAVRDLTAEKTLGEKTGLGDGKYTKSWWAGWFAEWATAYAETFRQPGQKSPSEPAYTTKNALQDSYKEMIQVESDKKGQRILDSALADLAKENTAIGIQAFIDTIHEIYGVPENRLDRSLFKGWGDSVWYTKDMSKQPYSVFERTPTYRDYINNEILPNLTTIAEVYRDAMSSPFEAQDLIGKLKDIDNKETFAESMKRIGFERDAVTGQWYSPALPKNATDKDRIDKQTRDRLGHQFGVAAYSALTEKMGGQANMAYNIMVKAGIPPEMFSNEPDSNDKYSWDKRDISYLGNEGDDGGAGGNYSGTGKLSSSMPKQVIVNITNLLSVQTIELMKTPEGKMPEIQDLKDMMAQALIDVVHDFDASWNG